MMETGAKDVIDMASAMDRVMGDADFLKEMLAEFNEGTEALLGMIRDAIHGRDAEVLSKTAHQLKGAASNLSLVQIAGRASELIEIGRSGNLDSAEAAFAALERAVGDFETFMKENQ